MQGLLYDHEKAVYDKYAGKRLTADIQFDNGDSTNYDVGIAYTSEQEGYFQGATYNIYSYAGDNTEMQEKSAASLVKQDIDKITINGLACPIRKETARYFLKLLLEFKAIKQQQVSMLSFTSQNYSPVPAE